MIDGARGRPGGEIAGLVRVRVGSGAAAASKTRLLGLATAATRPARPEGVADALVCPHGVLKLSAGQSDSVTVRARPSRNGNDPAAGPLAARAVIGPGRLSQAA